MTSFSPSNKPCSPCATLPSIHEAIKKAYIASSLAIDNVTLMGASKGQNEASILEAIGCGITYFGENRVQEAEEKWLAIRATHPHIELHLIGPLQTNKVKQALELFDVIQTVDRPKLAEVLSAELKKETQNATLKTQRLYIQVNTGKEPQKAGIMPEDADAFITLCIEKLHLPVVGLMCIPPHDQPPAPHFALLRQIAERHGLKKLSMGMSDDFEVAVRMGATCVRLGRALFGERN